MFLRSQPLTSWEARNIAPRVLAHLGDAVFHLFEREQEVLTVANVKQMHERTISRASSESQAEILDTIHDQLSAEEKDIVRRARNAKSQTYGKRDLAAYRKATAFEALLGYLYLTDQERLLVILQQSRGVATGGSQADS